MGGTRLRVGGPLGPTQSARDRHRARGPTQRPTQSAGAQHRASGSGPDTEHRSPDTERRGLTGRDTEPYTDCWCPTQSAGARRRTRRRVAGSAGPDTEPDTERWGPTRRAPGQHTARWGPTHRALGPDTQVHKAGWVAHGAGSRTGWGARPILWGLCWYKFCSGKKEK